MMICTVVLVVLNIAADQTSFAHGEKVCIQQPVKLVNFLADNRIKKNAVKRHKIIFERRRATIKGNG